MNCVNESFRLMDLLRRAKVSKFWFTCKYSTLSFAVFAIGTEMTFSSFFFFFSYIFFVFNGFSRPLSWTVSYSVPNISSVPANLTLLSLELSNDYLKNIFWLRLHICPCEHLFRSRTLIDGVTLVHKKYLLFQCAT